jgi:hypothetical protein
LYAADDLAQFSVCTENGAQLLALEPLLDGSQS